MLLRRMKSRTKVLLAIAIVWAAVWVLGQVATLYPDYLWFRSMGYEDVFVTELVSRVVIGVAVFLLTVLWLAGHTYAAGKLSPGRWFTVRGLPVEVTPLVIQRLLRVAAAVAILLLGLWFAHDYADRWFLFQQFLNATGFHWTDPVLGYDAGFYVFTLPVLEALKNFILALAALGLAGAGAAYFFGGGIGMPFARITRPASIHLSVLGAILLAGLAFGYWLDRFALMHSARGTVFGIGYVDDKVRLLACYVMTAVCVLAAVLALWSGLRMRPKVAVSGLLLVAGLHVVLVGLAPASMQRFNVIPNELHLEQEYLRHNIRATRYAYGLDEVEVREFPATGDLTLKDLQSEPGTLDNVRLWDWRVLGPTYQQLQGLRPYYRFPSVAVDRYHVDGRYRQVHVAARELDPALLPAQSRTWVNFHLAYTHGYGLCMSPVNAVTRKGLPEMWVQNIPPEATVPIDLPRAGIYFGELTDDYVLVQTREDEFDYPTQAGSSPTQYAGKAGVPVNSLLRRLLFSYYLGDWNILLTSSLTDETRILWRRNIRQMVRRLAPFLAYDGDVYPVIDQGRTVWVLDAYTTSDLFPYATVLPADRTSIGKPINYIRNSVKVTVDAYDGAATFYVADMGDPLILVARSVFPTLFRDLSEMPESLRAHMRYPIDLFDVQAAQYQAYHMTDPQVFYNKEDLWQRPTEVYGDMTQPVDSYYIIMTLPGEKQPEYLLMLPFTPARKGNMVGWMAGRCDGANYGKLFVYRFPRDRLSLGPIQVEASIDQDQAISPQISLWHQHGSRVVRGNVLVIPVKGSILYVEPLYLRSEKAEFPELTRVIAVYQDRVVMRETLGEALAAALGEPGTATPVGPEKPGPEPRQDPKAMAQRAWQLFEQAVRQRRDGDWAGYGETMKQLGEILERMAGQRPEPPAP